MSFSLLEHLAQKLNKPASEVRPVLTQFIESLKNELSTIHSTHIAGVGTFEQVENNIIFTPDEALSISVNSRFGALENELVHAESFEDSSHSSENHVQRNEENIDKSLLNDILPQSISENFFEEGSQELPDLGLVSGDENPFDDDLLNTDQENSIFSSQKSSNDTLPESGALDAASMKEEDQNANQSDQESADSNTEWSPFFEELEGEEFDIDTTIDLSADDWESEFPTPPSSPFSSAPSDNQQEDLYFDVDAAPDDTLFSTSNSAETEVTSYDEDLSWAANPLDDSTEFFEDDPSLDSSTFQSVKEDSTQAFSAEDEFFSPVTGSVNAQTPDDTLFSAETIYAEDASQEADDTIFLAPDQTVQTSDVRSNDIDSTINDPYAPPSSQQSKPNASDNPSVNPYAYRPSSRKTQSSNSWMMIAIGVVGVLVIGAVVTFMMGWFPFGSSSTTPTPPPVVQNAPPANVDENNPGASTAGTMSGQDPMSTDENTSSNTSTGVDPVSNPPVEPSTSATNSNPVEQTPIIQRTDIIRSRGGWTIVVASELQRNSAERIVDNFTVQFADRQYPVGILTTSINGTTRHRVGVGQFNSRDAASAALRNFAGDFPNDAWLSKIE